MNLDFLNVLNHIHSQAVHESENRSTYLLRYLWTEFVLSLNHPHYVEKVQSYEYKGDCKHDHSWVFSTLSPKPYELDQKLQEIEAYADQGHDAVSKKNALASFSIVNENPSHAFSKSHSYLL